MMMMVCPAELSYLRSFLQTMKREWTGIDRLRMDKFFQVSLTCSLIRRRRPVRRRCQPPFSVITSINKGGAESQPSDDDAVL